MRITTRHPPPWPAGTQDVIEFCRPGSEVYELSPCTRPMHQNSKWVDGGWGRGLGREVRPVGTWATIDAVVARSCLGIGIGDRGMLASHGHWVEASQAER